MIMKDGIMPRKAGINIVPITNANNIFLKRKSYTANAKPAMEQNSSVSAVLSAPTYKDQPKFFQKGILDMRMPRLSMKCGPNHKGGGTLKMSERKWVENTNMK